MAGFAILLGCGSRTGILFETPSDAGGVTPPDALSGIDSSVYGAVRKVPVAGGEVTTVVMARCQPFGIAVDSTNVYWMQSDGNVMKAPK
jgi:hypothetical protein